MYKLPERQKTIKFELPFGGDLSPDNRWIKMSKLIPWEKLEEVSRYSNNFGKSGNPAKNFRIAFGALFIQTKLKLTDEETAQQVKENPYLQYFLGLDKYDYKSPFSASLLVHFRKRLSMEKLNAMNLRIFELEKETKKQKEPAAEKDNDDNGNSGSSTPEIEKKEEVSPSTIPQPGNSGGLILDATCAPADVAYPTDLNLLNKTRYHLEKLIDIIHEHSGKTGKKPRTYRKKARKLYLIASKQRNIKSKKLRKALRQQLCFVRRNLKHVSDMLTQYGQDMLNTKEDEKLELLKKIYEQQNYMYNERTHKVKDRIISISQPHIRPIVRGKAKAKVEFGAKVSIAIDNGYTLVDRTDWNSFNEGITLINSVESYRERNGKYPEVVYADMIYRNRENLRYCRTRGIRLSGPRLGRPTTDPDRKRAQKKIEAKDSSIRNAVEGKFGEGKRAYGLGCIRGKLKETAESIIVLQFLVMNLWRMLRDSLSFFSVVKIQVFYCSMINNLTGKLIHNEVLVY